MNRIFLLLTSMLLCFYSLFASDVKLEVAVEPSTEGLDRPLSGMITITHPSTAKIDLDSFTLDRQQLSVELIKRVVISPGKEGTAISIYHFELPAKKPGIYTVNRIYVDVDGKIYHTDESKYEQPEPKIASSTEKDLLFRLEAAVEKPELFYKGQRARVIYRLYFNQNVELTSSQFPLLEAEGFLKIGDKQIREVEEDDLSVQEISQEVEAIKPGMFSFGPSTMEGYAYSENLLGEKIYQGTKLRSEAPLITVEVLPFPQKNQPLSFVGVVGDLDMNLHLITPSETSLEDRIQLEMKIQSSGNLDELKFPKLNCQPSFSGFFSIDGIDLTSVKKDSRSFLINLRPLTSLLKEIPPIEIASFDPSIPEYSIWQSSSIPIKVQEKIAEPAVNKEFQPINDKSLTLLSERLKKRPAAHLQIATAINLKESELRPSWWTQVSVLYFIPLAAFLLLLQTLMHQKWMQYRLLHQKKNSHQWLRESLREKDPAKAAPLLRKALMEYSGKAEAKKILEQLDAFQYGSSHLIKMDEIKIECRKFFKQGL